jgi:hypothetical protein
VSVVALDGAAPLLLLLLPRVALPRSCRGGDIDGVRWSCSGLMGNSPGKETKRSLPTHGSARPPTPGSAAPSAKPSQSRAAAAEETSAIDAVFDSLKSRGPAAFSFISACVCSVS